MTTPMSSSHRESFPIEPVSIPEDSTLLRTICCLPVFGTITSIFVQASLFTKWTLAERESEKIELLHIINQFKVASIIRSLLVVVIMVASIAYRTVTLTPLYAISIPILIAAAACEIKERNSNIQLINEIEMTGYKVDMTPF